MRNVRAGALLAAGGLIAGGVTAALVASTASATPSTDRIELEVAGRAGVPIDAEAAVMNVTVTNALDDGFVTVWPCGSPIPEASNLNFVAGTDVANLVVSRIGTAGRICLQASAPVDLLVDAAGYFPAGSDFAPADAPTRILDTRNGTGAAAGVVAADQTVSLRVGGRGGVPVGAAAVALNVTAVGPQDAGFVTVYPCDRSRPVASNLNVTAGRDVPNMVIARLAGDGTICLYSSVTVHLVADVAGHFPSATSPVTVADPTRVLDTRSGVGLKKGTVAADTVAQLALQATGVPADVDALVVNVTAVGPADDGFLTVHPCGTPTPVASNVNYTAGRDVPNLVLTRLGDGGTLCIYTSETTHLVADVTGWFPAGSTYEPLGSPTRLLDTRQATAS